jgi:translation initiation factor 1
MTFEMSDPAKPFHNPFGVLRDLGGAPPEPAQKPPDPTSREEREHPPKSLPRAVVRLERSGRGGKDVTVVGHLMLSPPEREVWLKALKTALGCGGRIEDDEIVLQGDQRERLPALLTARGVRKVTVA